MKKIPYSELKKIFRQHEAEHPGKPLTGHIVFTEDTWPDKYPLEGRTYVVTSQNKAFMPNMGGYSIFGYSLDGTDMGVRLEAYMAEERGGNDGWKVDYCYLVN